MSSASSELDLKITYSASCKSQASEKERKMHERSGHTSYRSFINFSNALEIRLNDMGYIVSRLENCSTEDDWFGRTMTARFDVETPIRTEDIETLRRKYSFFVSK